MNNFISQLTVLRGLENSPLFAAFAGDDRNEFLYELYRVGAESDFIGYLGELILTDENAFSLACARGEKPSKYLFDAYSKDLRSIMLRIKNLEESGEFNKGSFKSPFDNLLSLNELVCNLERFYKKCGYGRFIRNRAFEYVDGELVPIVNVSPVKLTDLKDYEYEKKAFCDNVENFLSSLPYSNTLMYGDRGCGKSSTVHAALNHYFDSGLRIIELGKENMLSIPAVRRIVARNPLKFIIFIDDLSLGEYDDKVSSLKASLEGSVSGGSDNTMIVATSNRRHIVKESFSDRENSVHPSDSMSEQLSLSERFGLTIMFSTTDKEKYLSIVTQLAADRGLNADTDKLKSLAERWALIKGGRSPRRAKQFVDFAYACEKRGIEMDF
ncbi:MAG: ATP-binding protein [Candidatus Coproplasma sp.]